MGVEIAAGGLDQERAEEISQRITGHVDRRPLAVGLALERAIAHKLPATVSAGVPALGRDRLCRVSEDPAAFRAREGVSLPWVVRPCRSQQRSFALGSHLGEVGWGLGKPPPASVAGMAEGARAPSHELRGSWALPKAANRVTLARQFRDTGNRRDAAGSMPSAPSVARVPSKGELCPPLNHLSIRQIWPLAAEGNDTPAGAAHMDRNC